ncbi:MAG: serine/threonine-protein kinase, partial [Thermoanaerobaculia bacterium]|nr:serine/threonine-protein kinase [Thermoanaerobaculia bacterium]
MGRVFLARDTQLGRAVALKFLAHRLTREPVARARFLREARSASILDHQNIGTIFEAGEHQGELFIAMAYYEGRTLRERLKEGPLPLETSLDILRSIAAGLAAAHRKGIVHRDIKPSNVMITTSGGVKILDFGLAKPEPDDQNSETELTASGATLGTVAYMSPEQARGDPVDHRTDLWSLGVIAYEALGGRLPFDGPDTIATLSRILTKAPPPLDHERIPSVLAELVDGLLQKDPSDRPGSAGEVEQ